MASENYPIPENPKYTTEIRALQNTDPANAKTIFNPLISTLIENTHAVKLAEDKLNPHIPTAVASLDGVHGMRWNTTDEEFQILDQATGEWNGIYTAPKIETIETLPNQSGGIVYTGSYISPNWNNYDSSRMSIGGTTSALNVGTYTSTFTPKDTYQWSDGTREARSVSWSIERAAGSLSISTSSMSLDMSTPSRIITVSRAGDGAVSATSSSTSIATVSVSGTTVTVTAKNPGSATITIKVAAGTNHTAPANMTCSVTSTIPYSTLSSNTWAKISETAAAGKASTYWNVGDTKNISLATGETLTLQIYGFDHDATKSITFGLKHLMANTRIMNSTQTNVGGYTGSDLYSWLTGTLYNLLPADLRSVVRSVNKNTSAGNMSDTIKTTSMRVFLFSQVECYGNTSQSFAGEGWKYTIFTNDSSRIKKLANGSGAEAKWWLRSPRISTSVHFCEVMFGGIANALYANEPNGICFGLCV